MQWKCIWTITNYTYKQAKDNLCLTNLGGINVRYDIETKFKFISYDFEKAGSIYESISHHLAIYKNLTKKLPLTMNPNAYIYDTYELRNIPSGQFMAYCVPEELVIPTTSNCGWKLLREDYGSYK